ncbi:hypothetical protein PMYN1_Chma30 (chromatophore) [Paulinella micropora]|uniref:F420-0:Gamma-glutamyl ligase n=1 Tax=Paulinella micropora TaxID=1928728 RepID=A0A1L5YAZ3_9EUKA|nr:hypothetical protein PCKR_064 [Paulinella micropora]AQX44636.1 hypothetical protein PFK_064 [Paulinella micropora]BBL85843.1 hypothetical protein PMYN1_Chma30 [Paulinella micropora]
MLHHLTNLLMSKEILLIPILILILLEVKHRIRPISPLKLHFHSWKLTRINRDLIIRGLLEIANPHKYMEVMVPEFKISPTLLSNNKLDGIRVRSNVVLNEASKETHRKDSYWTNNIVKGHKAAQVELEMTMTTINNYNISSLWIEIYWVNYGPFGYLCRREGVLLPLSHPPLTLSKQAYWHKDENFQTLPVRTHLLGPLDDPSSVIQYYAGHLLEPGDIIAIGETPLAIMQGRFHHPTMVQVSGMARTLCRFFHPTSSLATAVGLQTLIDIVGPSRVILAWILGITAKILGIRGVFYRLAGNQARLIDDLTGTTPPYDQTLVLGPRHSQRICDQLSREFNISIAVVDVNDLGKVKILAQSRLYNDTILRRALKSNPAGNANEQTPLVLIRPILNCNS